MKRIFPYLFVAICVVLGSSAAWLGIKNFLLESTNPSAIKAFYGNIGKDDVVRPDRPSITVLYTLDAKKARELMAYVAQKEREYDTGLLLNDIKEAAIDQEYSLTQELRYAGITPKNRDSAISQLKALGYEVQADDKKITVSWGVEK